ncbi:MAG: MoaD/ThiS family protein [Cyclobacteriaceae bacterium]
MATYKLRVFGIAREIMGGSLIAFESQATTVLDLKKEIHQQFPRMQQLNSLYIAVNESYAADGQALAETDEIALIPPVSGG